MLLLPWFLLAVVLAIGSVLPSDALADKACTRSCNQQGAACAAAARADGAAALVRCKPLPAKERKACKKAARRVRKTGLRQCRAGVKTCRGCCRSGGGSACLVQPPAGPPPCAGSIPADLGPSSTYRAYTQFSDFSPYDDVAISNRGWRAVATKADEIAFFGRDQEAPLFVKEEIPSFYTTAAIADDGSAFVVAGDDSVSYFECDGSEPVWVHYLDPDPPSRAFGIVGMSASGEWITVATCSAAYLFHRTRSAPVLTTSLGAGSCSGAGATAISRSGHYWIAMLGNASLALLDHHGVVWTRDFGPAAIDDRLPFAFDVADDGSVAVTTADRFGEAAQVAILEAASGATRWVADIPTRYPYGARFSTDGRRLAIAGSAVVFIDDTSRPPGFGSGGDWSFAEQKEFDQASVFPGSKVFPGSGIPGYDDELYLEAAIEPDVGTPVQFDVTADASYVVASVTQGVSLFHRQFAEPLRRFHAPLLHYKAATLDLSADGSWLMVQFPDALVRLELPPTEVIRLPTPLAFRAAGADAGDLIGPVSGGIDVDYWLLKPGRAATVQQDWNLWGVPGLSAAPFLLTAVLCQGDTHWTARHDLADGDVALHDVRQIHAPRCFASGLSGLQAMYLKSSLSIDPDREMSRDVEIFASVEVSLAE